MNAPGGGTADVRRVSVVVPVYNGRATIGDCLASLLEVDFPREAFEVLVVDNGSRDGTADLVARHGAAVRLLHESKRGPAAARNRGLREARGEVVAFTDADCVVERGWLRAITAPLADPTVGIAGGRILARRPCNDVERFGERIHDHHSAINVWKPPYAITMSWASRLAVLREVGLFDEDLRRVEDVDLSYRIVQAGYRVVYVPEAVVYHRNERTLWGLFAEGYAHGYHAIKVLRKHEEFLARDPAAERESRYWDVFRFGKRLGRELGSLRARFSRS